MQVVIMAAGQSTRTYPLTLTRPKPLLKIANKTILEHQLDALRGVVDEAVVVVWYRKDMIEQRFGASYRGIALKYVYQPQQLGTGDAILKCRDAVRGAFMAMNGDDLYDPADLTRLADVEEGALAKTVADPSMYGIYAVDANGCATRIVEKPTEIFSNLANVGVYKFTPEIFEVLAATPKSERGEVEVTSAVQTLADRGSFRIVEMRGYWHPIGYPWHVLSANEFWLREFLQRDTETRGGTRLRDQIYVSDNGRVHPSAHVTGAVFVGEGSSIEAGAVVNGPVCIGVGSTVRSGVVIDGPVLIGNDVSIGPNCFIRPATSIGNHCKIGHAVEIKNAVLFDHAAVPHLSYVGDSVIGEHANLGAGTITANFRHDGKNIGATVKGARVDSGRRKFGAIIGDRVHTGINTSIYPGRMLWPDTVTFPGESIRKDVTEIRRTPQS